MIQNDARVGKEPRSFRLDLVLEPFLCLGLVLEPFLCLGLGFEPFVCLDLVSESFVCLDLVFEPFMCSGLVFEPFVCLDLLFFTFSMSRLFFFLTVCVFGSCFNTLAVIPVSDYYFFPLQCLEFVERTDPRTTKARRQKQEVCTGLARVETAGMNAAHSTPLANAMRSLTKWRPGRWQGLDNPSSLVRVCG